MSPATSRWEPPAAGRGCYLDASALAKLYLEEPDSARLNGVLRGRDDLSTSDLGVTEVVSAAVRKHREGMLPIKDLASVRDMILLHREQGVFEWLSLTPEVHREAERLILARPDVPVRASDALHIAQALISGAGFLVTFDNRLARAAEAAGLIVFPHAK